MNALRNRRMGAEVPADSSVAASDRRYENFSQSVCRNARPRTRREATISPRTNFS